MKLSGERDEAQAEALKFSQRAVGLEPISEVARYRSIDEAAEWFGFTLTHGLRSRLGQVDIRQIARQLNGLRQV